MNCPLCKNDRVHDFRCEACGAKKIMGRWVKRCEKCDQEVEELHGLFVPHLCKGCMDKVIEHDRATGNICIMCRQVRSLCCC